MIENFFPEFIAWDKINKRFVDVLEMSFIEIGVTVLEPGKPLVYAYLLCPDEYILLEFTGLKDSDNNKIYDQDVIEHIDSGRKFRVFRVKAGFAINSFKDEFDNPIFFEPLNDMQNQSWAKNTKRIGNYLEIS